MIRKPLFIIGAPRSGTSILFRSLSMHADLWHLPRESHAVLEGPFHPRNGFESNRLMAKDVTPAISRKVHAGFERGVLNLSVLNVNQRKWLTDRSLLQRISNRAALRFFAAKSQRKLPDSFRLLEKTPKNSLRVPALVAMFPDARFVYLQRDAAQNIDSLIAGWRAVDRVGPYRRHRFCCAGYKMGDGLLNDYDGKRWKFALVPDWQRFRGSSCASVAAAQYFQCNQIASDDLSQLASDRVFRVSFNDFIAKPVDTVEHIFDWADLGSDANATEFTSNLPRVNDATPHLNRRTNQLRFPDEVSAAMKEWKDDRVHFESRRHHDAQPVSRYGR